MHFNTVRHRIDLLVDCGVLTLGPQTALDPGGSAYPSLRRKRRGMSRYAPAGTNTYVVNMERLRALGAVAEEMWEQADVEEYEWEWTAHRIEAFIERARLPKEAVA